MCYIQEEVLSGGLEDPLIQNEIDYFIGLVDAELKKKEEDLIEI